MTAIALAARAGKIVLIDYISSTIRETTDISANFGGKFTQLSPRKVYLTYGNFKLVVNT
ncbi:hypothetical protein [Merismopedia glauca]|uniref:hypothetical protein n=1 Tax=Merismopedia glauca TaxID=292586 RepID=UPI0015E67C0E|nr:hypothetical protein [Merismopedia glauca]